MQSTVPKTRIWLCKKLLKRIKKFLDERVSFYADALSCTCSESFLLCANILLIEADGGDRPQLQLHELGCLSHHVWHAHLESFLYGVPRLVPDGL